MLMTIKKTAGYRPASRKLSELPLYFERLLPFTGILRVAFIDLMILSMLGIFIFFDYASLIVRITRGLIRRDLILRYFSLKDQEILLILLLVILYNISNIFWILKPKKIPFGETYILFSFIFIILFNDGILVLLNADQFLHYTLEHAPIDWILLSFLIGLTFFTIWFERYVRKNRPKNIFDLDPNSIVETLNFLIFLLFTLFPLFILLFHPFYNPKGTIVLIDMTMNLLISLDPLDIMGTLDQWFYILLDGWKVLLLLGTYIITFYLMFRATKQHVLSKLGMTIQKKKKVLSTRQFIRDQKYKLVGLALVTGSHTIKDPYSSILWISLPLISLFLIYKDELNRFQLFVLTTILASIFVSRWILTTNLDTGYYNFSIFSVSLFISIIGLFITLVFIRSGYFVSIGLFAIAILITYTFWDTYEYLFIAALLIILGIFWLQQLQNIVIPSQKLCNSGKEARSLLENEEIFWSGIQERFSLSDDLMNRIQSYVYSTLQNDQEKVLEIIYEPEKPYNAVIFTEQTFYKAFQLAISILAPLFVLPLILIYIPIPFLGLYHSSSAGNFAVIVILSLYLLSFVLIWLPPIPIPKFKEMELEYRRFKQ